MPKAEEVQVIVELTHHTLHTLRAVNGTIEAGGECVIENKAALEALIGAVTPGGSADGLEATCVWPDGVDWHLSNDTEALLDRTDEAQRAVAAAANSGSRHAYAFAACSAANGGPISPDGTEKWLLAHCTCESLGRVAGGIPGTKLEAAGEGPAAFARIAAARSRSSTIPTSASWSSASAACGSRAARGSQGIGGALGPRHRPVPRAARHRKRCRGRGALLRRPRRGVRGRPDGPQAQVPRGGRTAVFQRGL